VPAPPDRLLGGRVLLRQPRRGYRVAIDPVLLAASVNARPGETVLDVGAGSGAATLCLAARIPGLDLTLLERDPAHAALGRDNLALNGLSREAQVVEGDIADPPADLRPRSFDHILTNPPYLAESEGRSPADPSRRAAAMSDIAPAEWVGACLKRLKPGGRLAIIHRADRLPELLAALEGPAGAIEIIPLWPRAGEAARRVILRARKGARTPAALAAGLVLHVEEGDYTPETKGILWTPQSLDEAMRARHDPRPRP